MAGRLRSGLFASGSKPCAPSACHAGSTHILNGTRYEHPEFNAKSNAPDFP